MVIVVVRWYITKGMEETFEQTWKDMQPDSEVGLFREFFSTPTDKEEQKYHTLEFESKHYSTFINVGIWKTLSDFDEAIGKKIPGRTEHPEVGVKPDKRNKQVIEMFDFEHKLRERIVLEVKETRGGGWMLPEPTIPAQDTSA